MAFDPNTGQKDHKRGDRIHFFSVGLSNFKGSKVLGLTQNGTKMVSGEGEEREEESLNE